MHPPQLSRSKISHHARNDPINGISAVAVLTAGQSPRTGIAGPVNPTNTGRHSQDVALYNGGTQLMIIHRTITVFP